MDYCLLGDNILTTVYTLSPVPDCTPFARSGEWQLARPSILSARQAPRCWFHPLWRACGELSGGVGGDDCRVIAELEQGLYALLIFALCER
jgi:hypothetical protein